METEYIKSDIFIVLDLDETLVYATKNKLERDEDFQVADFFVYKRPYLDDFLKKISHHFNYGIWSSGTDDYVQEIVTRLASEDSQFKITWGRNRCSLQRDLENNETFYEKKLHKLKRKGYKLEKILIVDNSPEKVRKNYGNAIYIKEYIGDVADNELPKLLEYLISIKDTINVRVVEKRGWRNSYYA